MVHSRWIRPTRATLPNALTIEVEEQRYADSDSSDRATSAASIEAVLELLAAAATRATFVVLGCVAEQEPEAVRAIRAAGHELGCHGYAHRPIDGLTPREFRADLRRARAALEDACGASVDVHRAPDFSITPACRWALDVLVEEGFVFDSSIDPRRHDGSGIFPTPVEPYLIRRAIGDLWEFPPPVLTGLQSSRLDLYALTRQGLDAANAAGRPFVIDLHSWEFAGPDRSRATARLQRLLADFAFAPLSESLARWWERAKLTTRRLAA